MNLILCFTCGGEGRVVCRSVGKEAELINKELGREGKEYTRIGICPDCKGKGKVDTDLLENRMQRFG